MEQETASLLGEEFLTKKRKHQLWKRAVAALGCLVVLGTVSSLTLPAITMNNPICGITEHTHIPECYAEAKTLICSADSLAIHTHTEACRDTEGNLICGQADFIVHSHDGNCYDSSGNLICPLPEIEAHTHDENCYYIEETGTTEEAQPTEAHEHVSTCYAWIPSNTPECGQDESEGHTHSETCWVLGTDPICGTAEAPPHTHEDTCFTIEMAFSCTQEETVGHTHADIRYNESGVLVCELAEAPAHTHGTGCYTEVRTTICGLEETPGHTHTAECFEAVLTCPLAETEGHTHTGSCYPLEQGELICQESEPVPETETQPEPSPEAQTPEPVLICEDPEIKLHTHTDACYVVTENQEKLLVCTELEVLEHQHSDACFQTGSVLLCTFQEHTHTDSCIETAALTEEEQLQVSDVILLIDALPATVAIEDELAAYKQAEDTEGLAAYSEKLLAQLRSVFDSYNSLTDKQREAVTNADRLPEYEYLLEALPENIPLKAPSYIAQTATLTAEVRLPEGIIMPEGTVFVIESVDATALAQSQTVTLLEKMGFEYFDLQVLEMHFADSGGSEYPAQSRTDVTLLFEDPIPVGDRPVFLLHFTESGPEQVQADIQRDEAGITQITFSTDSFSEYGIAVAMTGITSDTPTTVAAAHTSEFIELNLYDYNSNINAMYNSSNKYPGFQWNGGAHLKSENAFTVYLDGGYYWTGNRNIIDSIDFGNSMITDFTYGSPTWGSYGQGTNASLVAYSDTRNGAINKLDISSYGVTNRPIGMSLNSSITSTAEDVLERTLGSDGYPALADGSSLKYLFTAGTAVTKKNSTSIDGLFQQNPTTGEYYYNSRDNHAWYDGTKFILYNQILTPNFITYPFGNFLPFNGITNSSQTTQVSKITSMANYVQSTMNGLNTSDSTQKQLWNMLNLYKRNVRYYGINGKTWDNFSARDAIVDYFIGTGDNPSDDTSPFTDAYLSKLYNLDWDVETNFFFGMEMKMNFMQPKGGMTGNDTNGDGESDYPMVFYFTGDDDVWVYVDGVLFLDLSGIHRHVGGKIDFVEGKVYYYPLDTEGTGDVSSTPYQTYTFAQILSAAGKSTDVLNSKGTFKDYTSHSFNFYYMERGSGSSVCRLNFNFPLLRRNTITIQKELTVDEPDKLSLLGNPDFRFQVLKENGTDLFIGSGVTYDILDANDNKIGTGTTDANGIFTLKAGQKAVFGGISENAGKYFVRELLDPDAFEQYGEISINGSSETTGTGTDVTVGSDTFKGVDSPVKDVADGSTIFHFNNQVTFNKLGKLSITKTLDAYSAIPDGTAFDFEVTLDSTPLPAGTAYTVGGETRTVATAGIITLAPGETAVISGILSGSTFTVTETTASAGDYIVQYQVDDSPASASPPTGVIKTNATVAVSVKNSQRGAKISIFGIKYLENPDGISHDFDFDFVQVTDFTGETPVEVNGLSIRQTVTITKDPVSFGIGLIFSETDLEDAASGTFYFRVAEAAGSDPHIQYDPAKYVVEATVVRNADGTMDAAITNIWKDGTAISLDTPLSFVNALLSDLMVSKTCTGVAPTDVPFQFELTLTRDGDPLSGTFTTTSGALTFDSSGKAAFQLKHGESLTIQGIPRGTEWYVKELNTGGYQVSVNINDTGAQYSTSAKGSLSKAETQVAYVNHAAPILPATGGAGTSLYIFSGMALILTAALIYMFTIKQRREAK